MPSPTLDQVISVCTKQFGFPPGRKLDVYITELMHRFAKEPAFMRASLGQFLEKSGIPKTEVRKALDKSMAIAYVMPNYLKTWRSRCNPAWDLLGGDEASEDAGETQELEDEIARRNAATQQDSLAKSTANEPPAPLAAPTEAWVRNLFTNMEWTVTRLVQAKVDASVIKLDPNAKRDIRDLATETATAVAVREARQLVGELMPPRRIEIFNPASGKAIDIGLQHKCFHKLLRAVSARDHRGFRLNCWLTGPTGSGKTTAAENVAKALDLPFGSDGSLDADYKVTGFRNAQGEFMSTEFLRIYTSGGIYVADEIDNWLPSALLALNAALANGWISTPAGMMKRHPDACVIACANTWGLGATNDYVGRTKLDAASLDRFQPKIEWPIDEDLERAIARAQWGDLGEAWHSLILVARENAKRNGLKIIVSPRATFSGLSLLQVGFTAREVVEQTIASGISPEQFRQLSLHNCIASVDNVVDLVQQQAAALALRSEGASLSEGSSPSAQAQDDEDAAWAHFDAPAVLNAEDVL